ncbi:MAG: DUF58 domain-containing protein [Chloroflexi bacterium]|nr:DUF58 domain-containing protein [Chloroflexota bacterium]
MSETPAREPLFQPSFVRALEALALSGKRVPSGRSAGQWRSRTSGSSVEFSDYRTYAPGDEFRRIDWNAYARLERLFVRLYRAEEDLALSLLLDTSASMAWGRPTKARLAAQLTGALTFIALSSGDRVELATCRGAALDQRLNNLRGHGATWTAWRMLERLDCDGATDLNGALTLYARQVRGGGLAIVVSDLFSPTGYQQGIDALLGQRQDVVLVQVLAPDEIQPPGDLIGEWRLHDTEPAVPLEATITPGVVRAYKRVLEAYIAEAKEFCRRRGITYLQLRSDTPISDVVLRTFRTIGVVV